MTKEVDHLVLIVGSNPFPNYLVAQCFKPKKLTLIYTYQTGDYHTALVEVLSLKKWAKENETKFEDLYIEKPKKPSDIKNNSSIRSLFSEHTAHLNYTCGTKAMASQILLAFYETGNNIQDASYLDDESGNIWFDDGTYEEIDKNLDNISLSDIFKLHGLKEPENSFWKKITNNEKDCTDDESENDNDNYYSIDIGSTILEDGETKDKLNQYNFKLIFYNKKLNWKNYNLSWIDDFTNLMLRFSNLRDRLFQNPELIVDSGGDENILKDLLISIIGNNNENISYLYKIAYNKSSNKWLKFFKGVWFEVWLERLIVKYVLNDDFSEIHQGIGCIRKAEDNIFAEIDLCFIVGRRFYALSLTTSPDYNICRGKLFEISARARQLAGDHARSALICFVNDKDLSKLENCLDTSFKSEISSPNHPKVFGFNNILDWASLNSDFKKMKQPNIEALKNFFDK